MNKLLILLCSCCALLQACSKSKPHYTIDAGMKAAFNYLPGTYWVYKDSISGEVDSFAVVANRFGQTFTDESVEDHIGIAITEYSQINSDTMPWGIGLSGNIFFLNWYINLAKGYMSYNPLFEYPIKTGYIRGDKGIVTDIFLSYMLNGISFSNVAEINQASKLYHPTDGYEYDDWFYVSADAGIVKMRLNHPQDSINRVWELQRYHIVK